MVETHASVKGSLVRSMNRDVDPLFIGISVSHFAMENQEPCLPK